MPTPTVHYLKKRCDDLVGRECRKIGRCQFPGCRSTTGLVWVHFWTRGDLRLRYDPRNYSCGCTDCHGRAHRDREWLRVQWDLIKGPGTVATIEREARKCPGPIRADFYRRVIGDILGRYPLSELNEPYI